MRYLLLHDGVRIISNVTVRAIPPKEKPEDPDPEHLLGMSTLQYCALAVMGKECLLTAIGNNTKV
jgi:hypothetical protein